MIIVFWPIWDLVHAPLRLWFKISRTTTENETEVSFFNRQAYEQFKMNPQVSTAVPWVSEE